MKSVKINCKAADVAALESFVPFQGELKVLTDENYTKLKNQIIEHGVCAPIIVWMKSDENVMYILDGHQRCATLARMKGEGWHVPHLPYVIVEAESEEEAKKIVLSMVSQYGTITEYGLLMFTESISMSPMELSEKYEMRDVDWSSVQMKFQEHPDNMATPESRDVDIDDGYDEEKYAQSPIKSITLHFSSEEYPIVVDRLSSAMESLKAKDYPETILRLLDAHDSIKLQKNRSKSKE